MTAVYSPDDLPLRRAPEKLISCAMCVGQQIKIRGSSKELSQLVAKSSGTSQDPSSGGMSSHMENIMAMNSKLMTAVLDKAKILDELVSLKMSDRDKQDFLRSGSGSSSGQEDQPGLLNAKALPPATESAPLPLPSTSPSEDDTKENNITKDKPSMSLEEYEALAHQSISKRKAKSLDCAMKRPAACKAKPGPKPKAKAKNKSSSSSSQPASFVKKGIFGCIRCRGNTNGCSSCWNPNFQGLRFSSRQEWVTWKQQQDAGK